MLIPLQEFDTIIKSNNIEKKGILHVGAHNCEERINYLLNFHNVLMRIQRRLQRM